MRPPERGDPARRTGFLGGDRRLQAALAAVVALAVALGVFLVVRDDDGTDVVAGPGDTSTTSSTTSTVAPDPTTTTIPFDPATAARPAALAYAEDELGMPSPQVRGDIVVRESEPAQVVVPVVPRPGSPFVTEVSLSCASASRTCEVEGAATDNIEVLDIELTTSGASATVSVSGRSTAFEATVQVDVRRRSDGAVLAEDFVMGGANGEMGPFAGSLTFPDPGTRALDVVLSTASAEDGHVQEATVFRLS